MDWYETSKRLFETFVDTEGRIPNEEGLERCKATIDALHELFLKLSIKNRLRDEWPETLCDLAPFATGVIERSKKMGLQITIGISLEGWYAESSIKFPEFIRYMGDDFWGYFVRIAALGKAEFRDHGRPMGWGTAPESRDLFQNKGSLVFAIARDYTLLVGPEVERHGLGSISVFLPVNSDKKTVETFYLGAIDAFYRSNYLLFRAAKLANARFLKKWAKTEVERLD